jgi:hypothetical protein
MPDGTASVSLSKKSSSTLVAVRENRLKFTPPGAMVAPSGELRLMTVGDGGAGRGCVSKCFRNGSGSATIVDIENRLLSR